MHKVIVINLNGNAYQVDEVGHDALRAYLDRAEAQLRANPDLAEIMADLEQAIGEKCQRFLGPHKTVVSAAEVEQILTEMGPVDAAGEDADHPAAGGTGTAQGQGGSQKTRAEAGRAKRLYQIRDGAMISGVCNGLAAYFNIDVTIIRIAFVVLAVITQGAWVAVYFVMMFVIPRARTSEEHAEAQGLPFNAQEVIDQAKQHFRNNKEQWKRQWKGQHRLWRRQFVRQQREWQRTHPEMFWWREGAQNLPYGMKVLAGATVPIFGLISAAMSLLLVFALISLATERTVFGLALPPNVPLWAGLLGLVVLYHFLTAPLKIGRYAASHAVGGWYSPWANVVEGAFSVLFLSLAYYYVPEFRAFVHGVVTALGALLRSGIS